MTGRPAILICHASRDKKWAERLSLALTDATPDIAVTLWDDGKSRSRASDAPPLAQSFHEAAIVIPLVSPAFFDSSISQQIKRPVSHALRDAQGPKISPILLSHCVHELTWLRDVPFLNGTDQPVDSINNDQRDAVLAELAARIFERIGFNPHRPESSATQDESAAQKSGEANDDVIDSEPPETGRAMLESPYARRLSAFIRAHKETATRLQQFTRILLVLTLASLCASVVFSTVHQSAVLLIIIAGFGLFVASLALVFWAHRTSIEQKIIMARYFRTGFIDDTIPSRQRSTLTRKAEAILEQFEK